MNVLCVIAARGKSKRILNKNIRVLCGKPLIAYTIEKALDSKLSNRVIVSTDDSKIAAIAREYGIDVIIRPNNLALHTSPIDEAIRHAIRSLEENEGFVSDIAVLLQANVPIRKKGEIDEVINELIENKYATAVTTVYAVEQRPEWAKTIDKQSGIIKPFMEPTNLYRKQDLPQLYLLDGAITAIRVQTLMEMEGITKIHAYLGERVYPVIHDRKYAIEVDEKEDFELAEYYLRKEQTYEKNH